MSIEEAIEVLRTTNAYGTMSIAKSVIINHYVNEKSVLEDIKAEIETHHMNDLAYDEMSDFERGVLSIIDKHISGKE